MDVATADDADVAAAGASAAELSLPTPTPWTPEGEETLAQLLAWLPPPQALLLRWDAQRWAHESAAAGAPPHSSGALLQALRGVFPFAQPRREPLSGLHISLPASPVTMRAAWSWREQVRDMRAHAWSSYVRAAYPADELRPLSCNGRDWRSRERGTLDDVLGGYALTLVDALDRCVCGGWGCVHADWR